MVKIFEYILLIPISHFPLLSLHFPKPSIASSLLISVNGTPQFLPYPGILLDNVVNVSQFYLTFLHFTYLQ